MFNWFRILKGLKIIQENTLTPASIIITPGGTANTTTTLTSSQTSDRTITLPDGNATLVTTDGAQTLTNKTIDADNNTITDLADANIKPNAGINTAKFADGSVSNTEFQYIGTLTSDAQTQITANANAIAAHIADATDAHDASAISNVPAGTISSTDVQGAINELDGDVSAVSTSLSNHINDATDAHDASAISNVPSGNLTSTDVQGALNELQTEIDGIVVGTTTASNVGAGAQVFKQKVLDDLQFRTLSQGSNITITQNANDITIAATGTSGATQQLDNLSSTAVNADIIPGTDNTIHLGSPSKAYNSVRTYEVINPVVQQDIHILTANHTGPGAGGTVEVKSGDSTNGSGNVEIRSGTATSAASGAVTLNTNSGTATGLISATTGNASVGVSGGLSLTTGSSPTDSGDITLTTGSGGSSQGKIIMTAGWVEFPELSADPVEVPLNNAFYYNTTSDKLRFYNGVTWGDV